MLQVVTIALFVGAMIWSVGIMLADLAEERGSIAAALGLRTAGPVVTSRTRIVAAPRRARMLAIRSAGRSVAQDRAAA